MRGSFVMGLLVGIGTGLWMWLEYALGLHTTYASVGRWTGLLSIAAPFVGLIGALRRIRRRDGALLFRTGVPHVAILSLGATCAMALMSAVYAQWIHPTWLAERGISKASFLLQSALSTLIGGCILGLIILAVMRTTFGIRNVEKANERSV